MIPLIIAIVFTVVFLQLLRYGQERKARLMTIVAVNYVIAALASVLYVLIVKPASLAMPGWPMLGCGMVNGVLYLVHLLVMMACYTVVGVGVTSAISSLGAVIPILVSWMIWKEPIGPIQWVAVGMFPVGIVLMRPVGNGKHRWTLKGDGLLVLDFLLAPNQANRVEENQRGDPGGLAPPVHQIGRPLCYGFTPSLGLDPVVEAEGRG